MTRRVPTELALRPATSEDLPALAEVHLASRTAAVPAMPAGIHTDAEVRAWVGGWDLAAHDVWLATLGEDVVGYARFTPTWLDDLYVVPSAQGFGVGSALLDLVKAQRPDGFALWVFESNEPARTFYAARGLVELEHTDGSGNEEREPDVLYEWQGE